MPVFKAIDAVSKRKLRGGFPHIDAAKEYADEHKRRSGFDVIVVQSENVYSTVTDKAAHDAKAAEAQARMPR